MSNLNRLRLLILIRFAISRALTAALRRLTEAWSYSRKFIYPILLFVTSALFLFATYSVFVGWRVASSGAAICQKQFLPLKELNGYIELSVDREELVEPVFEGSYFVAATPEEIGQVDVSKFEVEQSGTRNYGLSLLSTTLQRSDRYSMYFMPKPEVMSFVSQKGSHRNFPFDSASFSFSLKAKPFVGIPVFRVVNKTPGFYLPCEDFAVSRSADGVLHVAFELRRDLLTRVSAVLLCVSGVFLAFGIAFAASAEALPSSVASFFFSLWSIRGIFGLQSEAFPTVMDVGILALCLLLLFLLVVRQLPKVKAALQTTQR